MSCFVSSAPTRPINNLVTYGKLTPDFFSGLIVCTTPFCGVGRALAFLGRLVSFLKALGVCLVRLVKETPQIEKKKNNNHLVSSQDPLESVSVRSLSLPPAPAVFAVSALEQEEDEGGKRGGISETSISSVLSLSVFSQAPRALLFLLLLPLLDLTHLPPSVSAHSTEQNRRRGLCCVLCVCVCSLERGL